jgi:hypothetical protein
MSAARQTNPTEGPQQPGDNPNKLNAKGRKNVRPRVKNTTVGASQSMRLGWIDPLPQVDAIHALGIEPNPEAIPAGEIELDFALPKTIAAPFAATVESVGDRIQMPDADKENVSSALKSNTFFKAAKQLFSTMQEHEKSLNQPLKAVFYDDTPVPLHMGGALGIIGHMDTKIGKVLIRDAGVLYKRWIAQGLHISDKDEFKGKPKNFVWEDRDSFNMVQRLAREAIADLVQSSYTVKDANGHDLTVSMPQLREQPLDQYFKQINDRVPFNDQLRACVSGLQMSFAQFRDDDQIPNEHTRNDVLSALSLVYRPDEYEVNRMRDAFEEWVSLYITDYKWRVESIFKTGPPPAGTTGYGAQTVSSTGNVARWQFPLSDADVNIGYLFSPVRDFKLYPRMVGYSKRSAETARAEFAQSDGKAFT